ncbi:MAG: UPF0236 family transposase-like protein [Blastocatellia bacterium]
MKCRDYSQPLQRVLVDFGAEESFVRAVERVREHYGIEVPASAIRVQTEFHGAAMAAASEPLLTELGPEAGVALLISETDGSMVPIVTTGVDADGKRMADGRKGRSLSWQEARLCLAREPGKVTARYGAGLGNAEKSGEVWLDCVIRAGAGTQTHLHCLGDGAPWIATQSEKRFGEQANYLCDFYHVSEYLAAAAVPLAGSQSRQWLGWSQGLLKDNRLAEVLNELASKLEPAAVREEEAPIRACFRYLDNRRDQLDYRSAIESGLPIGSGEVESGNRSVIQERLKISGAWWREENAAKMLALRVTRANGEWESYWSSRRQAIP